MLALLVMGLSGVLTFACIVLVQIVTDDNPTSTLNPTEVATKVAQIPLQVQTEATSSPSATLTLTVSATASPSATNPPSTVIPSLTQSASSTVSLTPSVTLSLIPSLGASPSQLPTVGPNATLPTVSAATTACPAPMGWIAHTVQEGETLFAFQLGVDSRTTVDQIMASNCLTERWIYEGQVLWLPPGAVENAPSSDSAPTALAVDPNAPPPPAGLTRAPNCPCEVTIRQGWRMEQIAELIDSLPVGFRGSDFLQLAKGSSLRRDFMLGMPPNAPLEGYFLPGTYTVTNEMDARAFITLVLDAFGAAVSPQWWADASARGLSPYQAVTLASIINRESRSPAQQVLVSSVFHNRLKRNQGLAATVTTQYALGTAGNWWPNAAGRISTFDSPYNTNLYRGLPPTPIASPSVEALQAAIYPADTNYLFFTGSCTGDGNAFAETYEQHLANVQCP